MAKQTLPAPQDDPNAGHGGSYILDEATGERVLVERTQEPGADQPAQATE